MENLYQSNPIIGKLWNFYLDIFSGQTMPTATNLIHICLSTLILNACPSIRSAFIHCIRFLSPKMLKCFYYTLGRAEILRDRWWRWFVRQAVKLIPAELSNVPILISVDDTNISKFGKWFDFVRRIFDHSIKDENKYINGHCFVTVVLSIPVPCLNGKDWRYLSFPLVHRLWRGEANDPKATARKYEAAKMARKVAEELQAAGVTPNVVGDTSASEEISNPAENTLQSEETSKPTEDTPKSKKKSKSTGKKKKSGEKKKTELSESKLTIAKDYISAIVGELRNKGVTAKIVVLCDSWYPKGCMRLLLRLHGVQMLCAARIDTVMTTLPKPKAPHTRGRQRKYGDERIFARKEPVTPVSGTKYSVCVMNVVTRLFPGPVLAFVTEISDTSETGKTTRTRRLYLCTDPSIASNYPTNPHLEGDAAALVNARADLLPLALYRNRWAIETCFYQLKTFWGMCDYRLLSVDGIENLLNLQLVNYSLLTLLPEMDKDFAPLAGLSLQERRYTLGSLLQRLVIIQRLCSDGPDDEKTSLLREVGKQLIRREKLVA